MSANVWRITGYRGKNDYDGPEDDNTKLDIIFDSHFKKEDVEEILAQYWSKFYRSVAIRADILEENMSTTETVIEARWKTREARNDYLWVECSNCGFTVENYKAVELGMSSTDVVGYKWHACPKCTAKMVFSKEN